VALFDDVGSMSGLLVSGLLESGHGRAVFQRPPRGSVLAASSRSQRSNTLSLRRHAVRGARDGGMISAQRRRPALAEAGEIRLLRLDLTSAEAAGPFYLLSRLACARR